jgi:DNA-binding NarL/FixJ family response regulator
MVAGDNGPKGLGAQLASKRPDLLEKLSETQRVVLEFLLEGKTEPEIAAVLDRSKHTVHDHTKAIYQLLGVNNRVHLVLLFSMPQS